jgi:RNA polymerase sigma-70 factor, ECF subfamily
MDEPLEKDLEAQLIEQTRKGDQRAFNRLVHHYYNRVFRTAFGVTRHEDNAREVTQQTWIKVWNKIDTFKGDSAFSTWLYRITTYTALDFLRANKKHQRVESIDASEENEGIKTIQIASDHEDDQPRASLRKREIMDGFKRALENLNETHRTALVLREIEGLSYEEIASIMQCKIGTVMSRIFNARRAIQTEMEDFK